MRYLLPNTPRLRGVLWLMLLAPFFFISYGYTNALAEQASTIPSLYFDWEKSIPLWPWSIIPYWSIDLLYGLSFLLPKTIREVDRHALRLLTAQLICCICFWLWPLHFAFVRPELDGLSGLLFDLLTGFDKPFNQAPSLHIALLVILWQLYGNHIKSNKGRLIMHIWMLLIGLSVLTTWQHHFIDIPTGALVGWFCVWLWPLKQNSPLQQIQIAQDRHRWQLAAGYISAAVLCALPALQLGGIWLWLFWPSLSLLLVALNYLLFGAHGFQKESDGRLSSAACWLFGPYLLLARLNAKIWTRKNATADEISDGVFLGRLPARKETKQFAAIIDLCAELPISPEPGQAYVCYPHMDLIAPSVASCQQIAAHITHLQRCGPVLVCCALGYSRSASAVAAWLLTTGQHSCVTSAEQHLQSIRPGVYLSPSHREQLRTLQCHNPPRQHHQGEMSR